MERDGRRLWSYVAIGTAAGIVYAVVDSLFDAQIVRGRLGALAPLHELVDHVLPVVTGALLGAVLFAAGQRGRLAQSERKRAEALRLRVEKVERDQAVWALAATVLHEVKNPLHSLGLLLDELAASRSGPRELVERAQAQIARISDELALLRSLQRRDVAAPAAVRLDELVGALADDLRPITDGVPLTLVAGAPVVAVGDASRIRVIVENLVETAVHAARASGSARMELEVRSDGGHAVVLVRDSGAGPPPEMEARMFDPLHSSKSGGLGLGLAVSRALARAMNGDVRYDGRAGGWTTFRLTLPLEAA